MLGLGSGRRLWVGEDPTALGWGREEAGKGRIAGVRGPALSWGVQQGPFLFFSPECHQLGGPSSPGLSCVWVPWWSPTRGYTDTRGGSGRVLQAMPGAVQEEGQEEGGSHPGEPSDQGGP